ncbi:MAG TPA: hypothetical protein VN888_22870 [Mycobacterium sp.]|nr:hypothetical protein [Mycobacterium sp.]
MSSPSWATPLHQPDRHHRPHRFARLQRHYLDSFFTAAFTGNDIAAELAEYP